jgi:hypothetical protein
MIAFSRLLRCNRIPIKSGSFRVCKWYQNDVVSRVNATIREVRQIAFTSLIDATLKVTPRYFSLKFFLDISEKLAGAC